MPFYVDSNSASSSLIEPPFFTEKIMVDSIRLDSFQLPIKIKLLKVEGEGAEPEILEGAHAVLSRTDFVSVDAGPERGVSQADTIEGVIGVLKNNNFKLLMQNPYQRKTLLFENIH